MAKKKRAVQFFRVSSKRQQQEGYSLEAQEKLAKKYLTSNRLVAVKSWSISESASKENDRKYFFEMIEFVKENDIRDIIFDKVDRACRGYKSAYLVEELISEFDVRFHFTRDNLVIDKNSPMSDKDRFGIGVWMGKRYTDNLRLEVIKGMSEREEQGYWNHKAPIGYVNVRNNGRASVELDERCSEDIKEIFQMYVTGNYPMEELTEYLRERIEFRKIGKSLVEKILSNPFYYGAMLVKNKVVSGKHEPLISKELWDDCQRIRGIRAANHQRSDKVLIKKPLMGLLRCGECGAKVTGEVKKKSSGRQYIYYHCANTKCPQRRVNTRQEKLLDQLVAAFEPLSRFTPKATARFIDRLKKATPDLNLHCQKRMGEIAARKLRIQDKLKQLEDLKETGVLDNSELVPLFENNKEALEHCRAEAEEFLVSQDTVFDQGLKVIELFKKAYDFMRLSDNLTDKARLAKIVLSNPVLTNGSIGISYEIPFDNLIKNLTFKNWWRRRELNPGPQAVRL